MLLGTSSSRSSYGRAASATACARRSFDAATICMALVIFCVALVAAMRLRRSLSEGIRGSIYGYALRRRTSREGLGVVVDDAFEFGRGAVVEVVGVADRFEDVAVLTVQ